MAKKVAGYIKLQIPAGKATPAPPVGPALGQHGVNIVEFTKQFNARTADKGDVIIPVVITVYADRSFSFITKTPPAAVLLKKACNIKSGSGVPNKTKVAKISKAITDAIENKNQIVEEKMENGVVKRHYECTVCKEILTQDVGDQYEKVSNYVTYLFEEYSPYMMWVFIATAGVWSIAMGIAIIIANKNEDKAKAKKMLVNYGIGLIVIFAILVAVPYLVQGIAALVAG